MQESPEKIPGKFRATAGPVFSRRGYLLFSDTPAGRIHKWEKGQLTVYREKGNHPRGNTFDHQGRLLTCEAGRVTRTEKDGKIEVLASALQQPADLVYGIDGSIYFSDPSAGAVWQVPRKGEPRKVATDCEHPFGVAFAPNQQSIFITDAARRQVRVYGVNADGALGNGSVAATFDDHPAGVKTDESGGIWVACEAGIRHFDKSGKLAATIALPEPATYCNWGEAFHDLYVTAGANVYRVAAKVNGTRTY